MPVRFVFFFLPFRFFQFILKISWRDKNRLEQNGRKSNIQIEDREPNQSLASISARFG